MFSKRLPVKGLATACILPKGVLPLIHLEASFFRCNDECIALRTKYVAVPSYGLHIHVTKPKNKKFDLHLISRHIDGGLWWYCGDMKYQTVPSLKVEEFLGNCSLRYSQYLDEYWQSQNDFKLLRRSFDTMLWIHLATFESHAPRRYYEVVLRGTTSV